MRRPAFKPGSVCTPNDPPRRTCQYEWNRKTSGAKLGPISRLSMLIRLVSLAVAKQKTGIAPFDRLVAQVMTRPPYNDARRVFWIVDNGSSHRRKASIARLKQQFPRLTLVHGPVHASWLTQIEIYFSIVQRKVLTPNDFSGLPQLAERLLDFQYYWGSSAKPFQWKFTRADLNTQLANLSSCCCLRLHEYVSELLNWSTKPAGSPATQARPSQPAEYAAPDWLASTMPPWQERVPPQSIRLPGQSTG